MTRDERQDEYVDKYVNGKRKGIYLISVRFGKTLLAIKTMKRLGVENVLILYPNITVLRAWEDEWAKFGWIPNVTYSTFLSAGKHTANYDMVICDEIHLLSENQRTVVKELVDMNDNFLGLTGTVDDKTKWELHTDCGLELLEQYTSDEAISEGIIADYKINIVTYKVDDKTKYTKKTAKKQWETTERKEIDYLTRQVSLSRGEQLKFHAINRMRFINKSKSLADAARKIISKMKGKRFILFGSDTKFIDGLGIHTYHNKSSSDNLTLFLDEKINDLGLCKLANTGVTFPNLSNVIITNIDSNSENLMQKLGRSLILDSDNKVADIYILCSEEEFQKKWLTKALQQVDPAKINYL